MSENEARFRGSSREWRIVAGQVHTLALRVARNRSLAEDGDRPQSQRADQACGGAGQHRLDRARSDTLGQGQRTVALLTWSSAGVAHREIAERLGCRAGDVGTMLARAQERARRRFSAQSQEETQKVSSRCQKTHVSRLLDR